MDLRVRVIGIATGLLCSLTAAAVGQTATPTYSLEAIAVNEIPIPGGPISRVTISHGDILTAQIFIRDWSPNEEKLRAYQVKLDDSSYASGEQGVIQPVDFQMNTDKDPNAFIDEADPKWIHRGRPTIPLTDSASAGYRWLSVLLDPQNGPVSRQDGKKFSCGTVKLTPSDNAKGTFSLGFVEDAYVSGLITPDNQQITPINYERLTVELEPTSRWGRIVSSDPPDGSIDARTLKDSKAARTPWSTVRLTFNSDCSRITSKDLKIADGSAKPPQIKAVMCEGSTLTVTLDRPIGLGAWTTITHPSSSTGPRLGRFPGDVDNNGTADTRDVLTLLDAVNGIRHLPEYQVDIDGDGKLGTADVLLVLDVITENKPRSASGGSRAKKN